MLRLLLLLSCIADLYGRVCPPSCEPPKTKSGCQAYAIHAKCSQDVRDISTSEANCGCLWQTYIQTIEPEAKVIFTSDGNRCYTWASQVCFSCEPGYARRRQCCACTLFGEKEAFLEEKEKTLQRQDFLSQTKSEPREFRPGNTLYDLLRRLERLESREPHIEIPKHRRRNGVEMISREFEKVLEKEKGDILNAQHRAISQQNNVDESYVGKSEKSKNAAWIEVVPEKLTTGAVGQLNTQKKNTSSDRKIYHVRQHWIDIDMPVDKFKLGVFMIILLLNILFVVVLIFCRGSGSSSTRTDTKPAGDLDASVYWPDAPVGRSGPETKHKSQLRTFFDKFKWNTNNKMKNKRNVTSPFLQMEQLGRDDVGKDGKDYSNVRTSSPYVDAGMYRSPKKFSRGLYENIAEEPDFLDHTYEDPLPQPSRSEARGYYRRKYSLRSDSGTDDGSSPTKYFPRDTDDNNKSVSFTLPPGTFITLQDRVDGSTNTGPEEMADERTHGTIQNELQQMKDSH